MLAKELLDEAIVAMAELHEAISPDENEDDGVVPAAALRKFVDAHARLMFERAHMDNGIDMAEDLRSVMRWESHRMGKVSSGVLRDVIKRIEGSNAGVTGA